MRLAETGAERVYNIITGLDARRWLLLKTYKKPAAAVRREGNTQKKIWKVHLFSVPHESTFRPQDNLPEPQERS